MLPASHPLHDIALKVEAAERLTFDDGLRLADSHDLPALGVMAHAVRTRMHGDAVYYNINRHLNPTNVCYVGCELCAYGDDPDAPDAWSYSPEECVEIARRDWSPDVSEFVDQYEFELIRCELRERGCRDE